MTAQGPNALRETQDALAAAESENVKLRAENERLTNIAGTDLAALGNAIRRADEAVAELDRLRDDGPWFRSVVHDCCVAVEQVKTLCEQRTTEHFDFLARVEAGEVIMMDRATGPAQVLVREVEDALTVKPVEETPDLGYSLLPPPQSLEGEIR